MALNLCHDSLTHFTLIQKLKQMISQIDHKKLSTFLILLLRFNFIW